MNFGPHTKSYSAHIDLPELHVHRKLTHVHTPCTWFFRYRVVYVVIRQLLLLRVEFRIPKLTFHSDLLHSTLEKILLFTPKLCGVDIGPGSQIARSVRPMGAAACVYNAHIESPSAPLRRPIAVRCTAVGLLPLLREEFWLLKLILHSELRRRAASRRALPCPSSFPRIPNYRPMTTIP